MNDERLNLVSASNFETVAMCPGQPALKATLPLKPEAKDPLAETGSRIHLARQLKKADDLSDDERIIYERGMVNEEKIVAAWMRDFGIATSQEFNEKRIWLHWPDLEPATSGQLDVHYVAGKHVLVVEWKTLWCSNLTPAEKNYQGRVQAVCAAKEYEADHVRVAFNKAMFGKSDIVDYEPDELRYAELSIFEKLWEAKQPDAPRHAGNWCRYCPCNDSCREAASMALLPATITTNGQALGFVDQLTVEQVCAFVKKKAIIGKITEAIYARAKTLTDEQLSANGLQRVEGRHIDPIAKVPLAFQKLFDGIKKKCPSLTPTEIQSALWSCMTLSKGDLTDSVRGLTGETKKDTQQWLYKDLLVDAIELKQAAASLEEV